MNLNKILKNKKIIYIILILLFFSLSLKLYFPIKQEQNSIKINFQRLPISFDLKNIERLYGANEDK